MSRETISLLLIILVSRLLLLCDAATLPTFANSSSTVNSQWQTAAGRLAGQWRNPNDVLTILMIIGGDVVQKALAQLSGPRFVPVAFSFGWVSYSFSAVFAVFGDGSLMPSPTRSSTLINARSGYRRTNQSWVLDRILRGVESSHESMSAALCVSVYRANSNRQLSSADWLWWSGLLTMLAQFILGVIPLALGKDWTTFLVTMMGTGLALMTGSSTQWQREKWGARIDKGASTYCLTRGNGFQHAIVIQNTTPGCLNLEDLAMLRKEGCSRGCKAFVAISACLWVLLLISIAGLQHNTWFLLGVGCLGMVQNVCVAAFPRQPDAMGIPLEFVTEIYGPKVMPVLQRTELQFPLVGAALVKIFFNGRLRDDEKRFWEARVIEAESYSQKKEISQGPQNQSRTSTVRPSGTPVRKTGLTDLHRPITTSAPVFPSAMPVRRNTR